MKRLFLTSSVGGEGIARSVRTRIGGTGKLKTAFITTPVETPGEQKDLEWYGIDRQDLTDAGFDFFDYTLSGKTAAQIEQDLRGIDVIYVSGGNGLFTLQESQRSGFIPVVRRLVESGVIYIGTSSGSAIAGPDLYPLKRIETEADAPLLKNFEGYGLVDFCVLPHWGSVIFRELYLNMRLEHAYTTKWELILLNDFQYVEVRDDWYRIVDVRKEK